MRPIRDALRLLRALPAALLVPCAIAQSPPPADGGQLVYAGDTTRASIGWDSDNRLRGELWHVLREDERTAFIGEVWITDRSAGGANSAQPIGFRLMRLSKPPPP